MAEFNLDFKALLNNAIISNAKKENPQVAEILTIFAKHGISAMDALVILMELASVLSDGEEGKKDDTAQ